MVIKCLKLKEEYNSLTSPVLFFSNKGLQHVWLLNGQHGNRLLPVYAKQYGKSKIYVFVNSTTEIYEYKNVFQSPYRDRIIVCSVQSSSSHLKLTEICQMYNLHGCDNFHEHNDIKRKWQCCCTII